MGRSDGLMPSEIALGSTAIQAHREFLFAIVCDKCGRRETYAVVILLATRGDARMTDLRTTLNAHCPRTQRAEVSIGEASQTNVKPGYGRRNS